MNHDAVDRLLRDREADSRRAAEDLAGAERGHLQASQALADAVHALEAASTVAAALQQEAHAGVAAVVSRCLTGVFGDEAYEFKMIFERSAGRTRCRCVFLKEGDEVDPQGAAAGGEVDVAAFALRLACMVLSVPQPRKLLVLDEPARFVHGAKYRRRMADLLVTLCEDLDVQVLMATGVREFMVGNVIEV